MPTPPRPNPALPLSAQIPSDTKEFQPRIGVAIDLTGDNKTVLRAGAGFFYAPTPALLLNQVFNSTGNPNVGVSFTLNATQFAAVQKVHPELVYPFVPNTEQRGRFRLLFELRRRGPETRRIVLFPRLQEPSQSELHRRRGART